MPSQSASVAIVWFRRDLRLADNPALAEAASRYQHVIPVYLHTPDEEGTWRSGAASRWWLHHSLTALDEILRKLGSRMILRSGSALAQLESLIEQTGAEAVFWNRRYEPAIIERDTAIKTALRTRGVTVESFNASLLFEPWEVATKAKTPHQVFTPFWKTCLAKSCEVRTNPAPMHLPAPAKFPKTEALKSWKLLPTLPWDQQFYKSWTPGEAGAAVRLRTFLTDAVTRYKTDRNLPGTEGTSRLSPHLHFGEIGPRQIWQALSQLDPKSTNDDVNTFRSEIGWREFAHHVLYHFPTTPTEPLRANFARFPWESNADHLRAWQRGLTGYPIVDAGMRELWATGWMHNRVRMIVGSFLTKHLRISWTEGAKWFWDTLVDADLANNTMGWQWIGGCGADAAPYFRIFNPMTQGEKFDTDGSYVRRWVPEIAKLSNQYLQQPWTASAAELRTAGVELGKSYPRPIVDHAEAREYALEAFEAIKSKS